MIDSCKRKVYLIPGFRLGIYLNMVLEKKNQSRSRNISYLFRSETDELNMLPFCILMYDFFLFFSIFGIFPNRKAVIKQILPIFSWTNKIFQILE